MNALDKDLIGVCLDSIEGVLNGMQLFAERDYEDLIQARIDKANKYIKEIKSILNKTN
ncbi:MAG: hypothetical protein E6590_17065 [Clostridiales bacterium]|uniref:Uncharacterized protein n=1 Tax=Zhenhengia yiwuensis TaxID=2763666 RepID=A0A926EL90_9FIRM|nr:hypothetical protein [Zhenhengia yiwuensis]MBC8581639.1 hypothetical protein [Zhenhengia yiwuensis]MDU6361643.1 hypothetical protein [Clostridiales bacterium]